MKKVTILIVEDDEDIREAMVDMLHLEGYLVETAFNGREALYKLPNIPRPCLILLDMMMPVMNGMEFLKLMRQNPAIADIPVLVISANKNQKDIPGVAGFLRKPVDIDDVIAQIQLHC